MSTTYEYVSEKLGKVESATKSISKEIFDAAKKAEHEIRYMWGYDPNAGNPEHHSGRALDFMVNNKAAGDWIRNYIWTNRARLRLQHVIWYQHITSTTTQPGVVRLMADRGSVTENHKDHVHALFFAGSYQAPSNKPNTTPAPSSPHPTTPKKTVQEIATEVIQGKWGDGAERTNKLLAAGYDSNAVQREVNIQLDKAKQPKKTINQIANEVIARKWGDGVERVERLTKAGYNASAVQKEVNRLLGGNPGKKSINSLAFEVMQGKWGNGKERVERLTKAGYNAKAIQEEVDRRERLAKK